MMTNICSENLEESKDFYIALFDFQADYESDWFIHLISEKQNLELGIIDKNHSLVPKSYQRNPQGFYITFVIDNADEVYKTALEKNYQIVAPPEDTFYGQRRFLLKDPNGALLDISSPIPDFKFS